MRDSVRRLLGVCLATLVPLPLLAQTTGEMKGSVVDAAGAPLPGVSIEARSPALQAFRAATTDASGEFRLPILPPGVYVASARLAGFGPQERAGIRVPLGETVTVPKFTLTIVMSAETLVSGEVPLVDTASTKIGTSLTANAISSLPLGRNYASVATTVAGTGQDRIGFTIYGATGLENQFLIDGIDTTGVRFGNQGKALNAEFIQEVEVRTGGYEAEFGQVIGGNINVITKSGGNQFHGDAFGYYDSSALASSDEHVDELIARYQTLPVLPKRLDAGVDLGGYFLKDRIWFFGAYDRVQSDQDYQRIESLTYPASGPPISNYKSGTDRTQTNLFSGKLTFLAGLSQTIALSVFGDPSTYTGRRSNSNSLYVTATPGPDSALLTDRENGGTDVSAKWDGLFGSHFAVQLQYGYHEEKNRNTSNYPDNLSIAQCQGGHCQFLPGSSPLQLSDETYRRNVYKATGTAFFGDHEIKAGLYYEKLNSSRSIRYGGGELIVQSLDDSGAFEYAEHDYYAAVSPNCVVRTDGSTGNFGFVDPTTCNAWQKTAVASQSPRAGNLAAFAQDSWRVATNLTINAGIRYEEQSIYGSAGYQTLTLKNEWSPRIGAVWDPLGNGKSKVFASYGRYYQTIPQDLQVRTLGGEMAVAAYNYTPNRADPVGTTPPASYAYVAVGDYIPPGLKGVYQDEIIGGVEYEFARNWSIGLKGIYRALGRVLEDRCDLYDPRVQIAGLIPPGTIASCVVINVGEGALGQILDPTNPDCFSDYPKDTVPAPCESVKARRYFRGLQLDLHHRFADRFYLLASYLYSKLEGNYDGLTNESVGQLNPGQNYDFDYIDVVPNSYGRLSNDRRHQFKLSGTYAFPFGLQVGLNSFVSSGAPLSILGYARPLYQVYLEPRGSYGELPWTYNVDLHLEYPLRFGAVSVVPIVDVFNLTNVQRATIIDQTYNSLKKGNQSPPYTNPTNPTFGLATAWQSPRLVRLGARVSF